MSERIKSFPIGQTKHELNHYDFSLWSLNTENLETLLFYTQNSWLLRRNKPKNWSKNSFPLGKVILLSKYLWKAENLSFHQLAAQRIRHKIDFDIYSFQRWWEILTKGLHSMPSEEFTTKNSQGAYNSTQVIKMLWNVRSHGVVKGNKPKS